MLNKPMTDEELVAVASTSGSEAYGAVNELMERYKETVRIKSRAYFLMGADSEDVIQEGMIGLYKAVVNFNPEKNVSFNSFANLCIDRQIISAVKQSTRLKQLPLNTYVSLDRTIRDEEEKEVSLLTLLPADRSYNPEESYIEQENLKVFRAQIEDRLSGMENQILDLFLQGKGYLEIAEYLNKSAKSIDNALQRIKKKISLLLEERK